MNHLQDQCAATEALCRCMILIPIFAEPLALYGLIVGIILPSWAGPSREELIWSVVVCFTVLSRVPFIYHSLVLFNLLLLWCWKLNSSLLFHCHCGSLLMMSATSFINGFCLFSWSVSSDRPGNSGRHRFFGPYRHGMNNHASYKCWKLAY